MRLCGTWGRVEEQRQKERRELEGNFAGDGDTRGSGGIGGRCGERTMGWVIIFLDLDDILGGGERGGDGS